MTEQPGTDARAKGDDQTKADSVVAQESAPLTQEAQAAAGAPAISGSPNTAGSDSSAVLPEIVDVRRGMFGAADGGDTSGYGGLVRPVAMPAPAQRPYGGWWDLLADVLEQSLTDSGATYGSAIEKVIVDRGEITLFVHREHLVDVARALRDEPELRFEICLGTSGVHYTGDAGRELHAVYHLLSITHGGRRVRLEVTCPDADRHIPSVIDVYPGNDWHERETWDMFGIIFDGHPALTRILMPDDWPGHPQRKDYPLGGVPVEYHDATIPPPDTRRSYR